MIRHPLLLVTWVLELWLALAAALILAVWIWGGSEGSLSTVLQLASRSLPSGQSLLAEDVRGSLREGCAADLLLFDPATVGRGARSRANDLPADATRVVTKSCGVHGVWVNGQRVADEQGTVHKPLPGKLLRDWH